MEAKIKVKYAFETPGNAFNAKTAAIFPIGPNLNSFVSTCGWSVILELSALSREKAFQAHFDLFSIWLTLLWTCPVRLPSILALLFHNMWSTCLLALFSSWLASSLLLSQQPTKGMRIRPRKQSWGCSANLVNSRSARGHLLNAMVALLLELRGAFMVPWDVINVCKICLTRGQQDPRFHGWMHQHYMLFGVDITVEGILGLGNILHINVKTQLVK